MVLKAEIATGKKSRNHNVFSLVVNKRVSFDGFESDYL